MREIKFRAYQPHDSLHRKPGMYQVSDIVWYDKTPDGYTGEVFFTDGSNSSEYLEDVQLMQYTGLKDKNGVEIYEGDIMNVRGEIGDVEYDENNVCFVVNVDIDYNPCIGRYEVIGNIYENPELLTEVKP